jgi:HPt (histidine-containing phosphotransfer) domain-containing protein
MTDYSYALVHLFEEDKEYLNLFKEAIEEGREVILDNSIFELEKAFDADRFAYWVNELQPTWYIVPDSLENSQQTIENMLDWNEKYASKVTGKKIGVVQGKTYSEIVECYDFMANHADIDMIAISFDYSYFEQEIPHPNKYVSWMLGRVQLLGRMLRDGIIDTSMKHHLLGNSLPLEGKFYKNYDWIYSMDTSNPITHGIKGITYQPNFGLYTKVSQKLFTMINTQVTDKQKQDILLNIQEFRKYWVEDQL